MCPIQVFVESYFALFTMHRGKYDEMYYKMMTNELSRDKSGY